MAKRAPALVVGLAVAVAAVVGVAILADGDDDSLTLDPPRRGERIDLPGDADDTSATPPTTPPATTPPATLPPELASLDGTLVFVAPDAPPDGPGTIDRPTSLGSGARRLGQGDHLVLRGGTYDYEQGELDLSINGTAQQWTTIRGFPGETATLRARAGDGIRLVESSFVEVRDLVFEGPSRETIGAGIRIDRGSTNIRVIGNTISGFAAHGVGVTQAGTVHIEANTMFDLANRSRFQTSAISLYQLQGPVGDAGGGFDNVITGNVVYRAENIVPRNDGQITDGNCIIVDDSRNEQGTTGTVPYSGSTLVENNLCFDNGGRGVFVFKSDHVVVRFNTLYQNLTTPEIDGGEITLLEASDVEVYGNLLWPTDDRVDLFERETSDVERRDNVGIGPGASEAAVLAGAGEAGLAAPSVDPDTADFRLVCGTSPAVDLVTGSGPESDLDGRDRAGPADAGAFELVDDPAC